MVSIIARIAGKLAMLVSLTQVAAEPKKICMLIDADLRLAAAAGGAARYIADTAGLDSEAITNFQAATISACTQAFANLLNDHARVEVTVSHYADRIEVAISHQGDAIPAVGLDEIAGFAANVGVISGGKSGFAGVDRVQFDTEGPQAVTRLTKYIGQATPRL